MKKVQLPEGVEPPKALVKKPKLRKLGPIEPGLREGRGFSLGELKEAGLTVDIAKRLGIYVDKRRKSVHPWNIKALKEFIEQLRSKGLRI
jgi:large subunit ribosomal protein L13e